MEISKGFQSHHWSHTPYMIKNSSLIPPDTLLYKYLSEDDVAVISNLLEIERKNEGNLIDSNNLFLKFNISSSHSQISYQVVCLKQD